MYVHTRICSWNQPGSLVKETTGTFVGVLTRDWTITGQMRLPLHRADLFHVKTIFCFPFLGMVAQNNETVSLVHTTTWAHAYWISSDYIEHSRCPRIIQNCLFFTLGHICTWNLKCLIYSISCATNLNVLKFYWDQWFNAKQRWCLQRFGFMFDCWPPVSVC